MIFARNRKAGSFSDIDCGQLRFNNPTRTPIFVQKTSGFGKASFSESDAEDLSQNG
jgi:hypothetical protein